MAISGIIKLVSCCEEKFYITVDLSANHLFICILICLFSANMTFLSTFIKEQRQIVLLVILTYLLANLPIEDYCKTIVLVFYLVKSMIEDTKLK